MKKIEENQSGVKTWRKSASVKEIEEMTENVGEKSGKAAATKMRHLAALSVSPAGNNQ
jgi:hypothetical protein